MYHNASLKVIFEKLVSSSTPLAEKNAGITNKYGFQMISEVDTVGSGSAQEGNSRPKVDWETGHASNGSHEVGQEGGRDSFSSDISRVGSQESITKHKTRTVRSGSFSNNYRRVLRSPFYSLL